MKKFLALIFVLALAVILIPWLHPAGAVEQSKVDVYEDQKLVKSVVFAIGMDQYFINGQTPGIKMDAVTFLENGRTFVPVRYLGRALGLTDQDITWDNDKNKATLKGKATLEMTIDKPEIITNGQAKAIDVDPVLKSEPAWRIYLPARFVAEGLGYQVEWDDATQTVICYPVGESKPDVSAVQQYVKESVAKPEAVRELEGLLGVVTHQSRSYWWYSAPWEKSTWDEATRKAANENGGRSYLDFRYDTEDGLIGVDIRWVRNLSDIRNVQLDLSSIEKALHWKFPGQPDQVQGIMAYAWQVAEKTRESGGFERLPWKDFQVEGWEVNVGSVGGNFVGLIIRSEPLDSASKAARDAMYTR